MAKYDLRDLHIWLKPDEFETVKRAADEAVMTVPAYAKSATVRLARARIAELEKLL